MERLQILRKFWHLGMGVAMVVVYQSLLTREQGLWALAAAFVAFGIGEWVRLRFKAVNALTWRLFKKIMRENEMRELSGTLAYIAGAFIAVTLFPKAIAMLALLHLAFGDPVASLVGTLVGEKTIRFRNGKSIAGLIGSASICALVTVYFLATRPLGIMELNPAQILLIAVIGGLVVGIVESVDVPINDNLSIPIMSGFVTSALLALMGQAVQLM